MSEPKPWNPGAALDAITPQDEPGRVVLVGTPLGPASTHTTSTTPTWPPITVDSLSAARERLLGGLMSVKLQIAISFDPHERRLHVDLVNRGEIEKLAAPLRSEASLVLDTMGRSFRVVEETLQSASIRLDDAGRPVEQERQLMVLRFGGAARGAIRRHEQERGLRSFFTVTVGWDSRVGHWPLVTRRDLEDFLRNYPGVRAFAIREPRAFWLHIAVDASRDVRDDLREVLGRRLPVIVASTAQVFPLCTVHRRQVDKDGKPVNAEEDDLTDCERDLELGAACVFNRLGEQLGPVASIAGGRRWDDVDAVRPLELHDLRAPRERP